MDNSIKKQVLCSHNDIILEIMSMLDAEDQLAFARVHGNIEEAFLEHIWKQTFKLDSNIVEYNGNFKALIEKNWKKLITLSVKGGLVDFNWHRIEKLVNLTEICLNDVSLSAEDVYKMASLAKNLEILKLENIDYNWSEPIVRCSFKLKSLKKLHLLYHYNLQPLIENCPNLEELIIRKIYENDIENLKHFLITHDIIISTLNSIRKDHARVSEDILTNNISFEIIARKDRETILNIQTMGLDLHAKCEKFIEHFQLMHLENVQKLNLNFSDAQYNHVEFIKLLTENCKQLKTLDFSGTCGLVRGLKLKTLATLKEICINSCCSAEDLFQILLDLNLHSLTLNCDIVFNEKSTKKQNYERYGNSIEILKCYGMNECQKDLEIFFQLYSNGFQNLKKLCLYGFDCIEPMLELALKQFRNIKYLNITLFSPMNEKTLAILIQFPLLKCLKLSQHSSINHDHIEYLRQHIDRVID